MNAANGYVEVPSLDGFTANDPAVYEDASRIYKWMALYCELKAKAMKLRLKGKIAVAVEIEKQLDKIHDELPEWAKW